MSVSFSVISVIFIKTTMKEKEKCQIQQKDKKINERLLCFFHSRGKSEREREKGLASHNRERQAWGSGSEIEVIEIYPGPNVQRL